MKHITQEHAIQLIKDKKLSPHVLKPYREKEDEKEISKDDLIVSALCEIRNALTEANKKQAIDNSDILEGIGDKIEALTRAIKEKPIVKPVVCECIPEYDNDGRIEKIIIRPQGG